MQSVILTDLVIVHNIVVQIAFVIQENAKVAIKYALKSVDS